MVERWPCHKMTHDFWVKSWQNFLRAKESDCYVKTSLNWFVVDCDLNHSVFAFRIADIGGQNSDEIDACATLGTIWTFGFLMMVTKSLLISSYNHIFIIIGLHRCWWRMLVTILGYWWPIRDICKRMNALKRSPT